MTSTLVTARDRQTLVQVVLTAFPHSSFPRGPYERAADAVLEQAGQDPRFLAQLLQGLEELDAQREAPFADLDTDTAAVWTRNPSEMRDRQRLEQDWGRRLCGFLGLPPGPALINQHSLNLIV